MALLIPPQSNRFALELAYVGRTLTSNNHVSHRDLNLSLSAVIMTECLYILLYILSIINTHPWGNVRTIPQYKGYSDINKIN